MNKHETNPPDNHASLSFQDVTGTILVIDDDDLMREFIIAALEKQFSVRGFDNAGDALAHLRRYEVDLVLSDIVMPDMSGIELRQEINQYQRLAAVPFLFLTGQDNQSTEGMAASLGIDDYITKPVDPDHLIQVTRRIITRSRQLRHNITRQLDDSINAALTPSLPDSVGRYDLALRFQSAGIGGGDLVLHRRLLNGDLIVMADILGHGIQAKFYAHAYAGYISGMLTRFMDLSDPAQLLSDFNQAVCRDYLLGSSSITSIALYLGDDGQVLMAGAGHPWPLLYRHDESRVIEKVDVGGVLLGLSDETVYQSQTIELNPGDQLVFFTDGLYELGDDWSRPDCGYEQLKSVIRDHAGRGGPILADKIMEKQLGQKNQSPGDDITLAIIGPRPD